MRKFTYLFLSVIVLFCVSGCDVLEFAVSDINGWDLSACVSGFSTCQELFTDNVDRILGGQTTVDNLFPE